MVRTPRFKRPHTRYVLIAGAVVTSLVSACGSFTPAGARPGGIEATIPRMPPDFALSMSIHPPSRATGSDAARGVPAAPGNAAAASEPLEQPAWYLVEPDGRLRASPGVRTAKTPVPGIVRQLSAAEVRELWSTVRASGLTPGSAGMLAGETGSARTGAKDLPERAPERPTAILFVAGEGERRTFEIDLAGEGVASLGARDLAARLRQLAGLGAP